MQYQRVEKYKYQEAVKYRKCLSMYSTLVKAKLLNNICSFRLLDISTNIMANVIIKIWIICFKCKSTFFPAFPVWICRPSFFTVSVLSLCLGTYEPHLVKIGLNKPQVYNDFFLFFTRWRIIIYFLLSFNGGSSGVRWCFFPKMFLFVKPQKL